MRNLVFIQCARVCSLKITSNVRFVALGTAFSTPFLLVRHFRCCIFTPTFGPAFTTPCDFHRPTRRVVFEAEASGGGSKAGGLPHPSLSPFPPLPLSIPLSFQTNQWEGRSDPVRGEVPGSPPLQILPCPRVAISSGGKTGDEIRKTFSRAHTSERKKATNDQ